MRPALVQAAGPDYSLAYFSARIWKGRIARASGVASNREVRDLEETSADALLRVRLTGPGVTRGRILLTDLVHVGRQLQVALDRVALVLAGGGTSLRPGRRPEHVRSACALEVVATTSGSFELALDLRRDQITLPGIDVGEAALEKLVVGLERAAGSEPALPPGYDVGVLAAWREAGSLFDHGVTAIELVLRTRERGRRTIVYDTQAHRRVIQRLREPVRNLRSMEGRLLMADFKQPGSRCRLHPPVGAPVECVFGEELADVVYDSLRSFVRVTGQAEEDAETGRILRLRMTDVEPVAVEDAAGPLSAEDFWREPTIEGLGAEQGIESRQPLEALIGAGADLWESDEDLARFLEGVDTRRRYDHRHERGG